MKPYFFKKCQKPGCQNLATHIGQESFHYCLKHLDQNALKKVKKYLSSRTDLQFTILDGRNSSNSSFFILPATPQRNSDLRGSIFIAIDFSLADLEQTDFSFCHFINCDLRRTKLYNASLRWSCFNKTLLRQADISNSDCRWMQAQSEKLQPFESVCERLAAKHKTASSGYLHLVGRDNVDFFFGRFGYEAEEKEKTFFNNQNFENLAYLARETNSSCSGTGFLTLQDVLLEIQTNDIKKTDWSGAILRNSDLAYSNFDHTLAIEVVFDGSDLHEASFCHAILDRSSFLNVSFSRCDLHNDSTSNKDTPPVSSNFQRAHMENCILDGTNLERLFFEDTILNNASIQGATLRKAIFSQCKMRNIAADDVIAEQACFIATDLSGASFSGAILNKARFYWNDTNELPITLNEKDSKRLKESVSKKSTLKTTNSRTQKLEDNACNLKATNFQAAELEHVVFDSCELQGALFQAASLKKASLKKTKCMAAQFKASNIDGTDFSKADLTSSSFQDAGIEDTPPIFEDTTLTDAILSGMDLTGTEFKDSKLDGIDLSDCNLSDTKFLSSPMTRASLRNTVLNNAHFQNVDLTSSDISFALTQPEKDSKLIFQDCIFNMANMQGVQFKNVKWLNCNLKKSNFSFAIIKKAIFQECELEDISFNGADCKKLKIKHPKNFDGADWSNATLKKCLIMGDKKEQDIKDNDFFKALSFNGATIEKLQLKNIYFNTILFQSSALIRITCDDVAFVNASFKSAKINIEKLQNTHFFYCDFTGAAFDNINNTKPEGYYSNIILGCNFIDTILPDDPRSLMFVDCSFHASSFLATPEEELATPEESRLETWKQAIFVHCQFKNLKYYGLKEASEELGNQISEDKGSLKFSDLIESLRLTLQKNTKALTSASSLKDRFSYAQRLKMLIPDETALKRDRGYSLARNLCRELRKDFFSQGFSELASDAYVMEMDYELNLRKLRYAHKLFGPSSIESFQFGDDFTFELNSIIFLIVFIGCLFTLASGIISFFITPLFSILLAFIKFCPSCALYIPIDIIFFLILFSILRRIDSIKTILVFLISPLFFLKARGVRLFLTKYIYSYGERVGKMLLSACICILIFASLYYAFLPTSFYPLCPEDNNQTQESENCSLYLSLNTKLPRLLFFPLYNLAQKECTGYLKEGDYILRKKPDSFFDFSAFCTCLYFSGITFTTLGYGDISPHGLVRYLAMFESGLGAFLIALFVFSFTRRNALR